jgi:hypothetical protein
MGHTRRSLFAIHEEAIDSVAVVKKEAATGQMDLFGDLLQDGTSVEVPNLPEWTKRDLLAHEREMLGLYVSDHPLAGMEAELMRFSDMGTAALRDSEIADGETVTLAGLTGVSALTVATDTETWTVAPDAPLATSVAPVNPITSYRLLDGSALTLTLKMVDQFGSAIANESVVVTVSGRNSKTATLVTDASGLISYSYTDTVGAAGTPVKVGDATGATSVPITSPKLVRAPDAVAAPVPPSVMAKSVLNVKTPTLKSGVWLICV